jgi:hypothetical protein
MKTKQVLMDHISFATVVIQTFVSNTGDSASSGGTIFRSLQNKLSDQLILSRKKK